MITVNHDNRLNDVKDMVNNHIEDIKANAEKGLDVTEIIIPDGYYEVRPLLIKTLEEEHGTKAIYLDLGGTISINHGTYRTYKLRILQYEQQGSTNTYSI